MYATKHLDWLSITMGSPSDFDGIFPVAEWHYVGAGHHGYKSAYQDRITGARLETDSASAEMGTHCTLSGQVLHDVRTQFAGGDDDIVRELASRRARCSRCDLAINIHEGQLTVRSFYKAYKSGTLETQFRRAYYVEGVGNEQAGDTFYLGSPKSDRQLRIYDKAAEQGIVNGEAWIRLELVLRDLRAKAALEACHSSCTADAISAHVGSCLAWSSPEYDQCLGSAPRALKEIPRRETSTERWLRDQCAPALAKVVAVKPEFMVEFMASFQASLDELRSSD